MKDVCSFELLNATRGIIFWSQRLLPGSAEIELVGTPAFGGKDHFLKLNTKNAWEIFQKICRQNKYGSWTFLKEASAYQW